MKEGDTSGIIKGVGGSVQYVCLRLVSRCYRPIKISTSVLGIVSHIPWATRWLDQFVQFVGLGLVAINIADVIVDRRIKNGSTSRDLMFHIVSFRDIFHRQEARGCADYLREQRRREGNHPAEQTTDCARRAHRDGGGVC
jgi:hypothetical protein